MNGHVENMKTKDAFDEFLERACFDPKLIFQSMSQDNRTSYFYFGDMKSDIFYISDNMKNEFGFESNVVEHFLKAWEQRIVSEKSKEAYRKDHENLIREKRTVHDLRYQVRDISGRSMWIRCYGVLKWNKEKTEPLFFSGRITHQDKEFVVDPVTNFPRTSVMLRRLKELHTEDCPVRTIGFSLNNITEINNTRGRGCADRLMRMIAEELNSRLSAQMSFYRLDGMRCIAIVDASCRENEEILIEEIQNIVAKWYQIMGISVHQTCSFAFMEYSSTDIAPADFLEQMVLLIKVAKHDSLASYVEYAGDNIRKVKRMSKMSLTLNHDVMHGMENFKIEIQPIVSGSEEKIIGGEVLLRWKFEEEEIAPSVFIPMLEKSSMMYPAGRWVFEQVVCACSKTGCLQDDFSIAFNMSMRQLSDDGLVEYMQKILKKYGLDGSRLIAEMTEDFMDEEPEKMYDFVEQCRKMGIHIAMDDFGNGYSSLRRLLQYPSSVVKLDRSLLTEMMKSEEKKNFISSIVYACHKFGKKVCMEGVETREQIRMIKEAGCDMIQGYYYYKPMSVDEMCQLLTVS